MAKTALAPAGANLPATDDAFSLFEGYGTGFENVTSRDLLIPRMTILQGLSPQVTQGKSEYDKDAKVGMIYDVGLKQGFPEGIQIIPVHYSKAFLEWAPRSSGKGLVQIHEDESILDRTERDEKNRSVLPNGNYIAETSQFFVLNLTADGRKSFIPLSSTQLKKARFLLTLAQSERITRQDGSSFTPPLFYRSYNLTTVPESNNEGTWMGWKIERGPAVTELDNWKSLVEEIKTFREQLKSGAAKGDLSSVEAESASSNRHDDEIPF